MKGSLIRSVAKMAAQLSVVTTAWMMIAGKKECGSAWAAVNCVTHIVDGDDKPQPLGWSPRESIIGAAINCSAMASWSLVYHGALRASKKRPSIGTGILCALTAYIIDYHVVPKRLTPGIEKRLGSGAIGVMYLLMALTFSE